MKGEWLCNVQYGTVEPNQGLTQVLPWYGQWSALDSNMQYIDQIMLPVKN